MLKRFVTVTSRVSTGSAGYLAAAHRGCVAVYCVPSTHSGLWGVAHFCGEFGKKDDTTSLLGVIVPRTFCLTRPLVVC